MSQQTAHQILKNLSEQTPDAPAIPGLDRKPATCYSQKGYDFYLPNLPAKAIIIHTKLTDSPPPKLTQAYGTLTTDLQPQLDSRASALSASSPDVAQPDDVALVLIPPSPPPIPKTSHPSTPTSVAPPPTSNLPFA